MSESGDPTPRPSLSARLRAELEDLTDWLKQWTGFAPSETTAITADTGSTSKTMLGQHRLIPTTISSQLLDTPNHGTVLHVVEYFQPETAATSANPLVLALPFTSGHSRNLKPFAEALLRQGMQAVAIDPPGHGRSAGERGVFRIVPFLEQIRQLAELYRARFPTRPILLAGTSWGGDVAILSALYQEYKKQEAGSTNLIQGVIGQAVITPWQRDVFRKFRPDIRLLFDSSELPVALVQRNIGARLLVAKMFEPEELYTSQPLRLKYQRDPLALRSYETESYLSYLQFDPHDLLDETDRELDLTVPALVLHGERDRLVPSRYARAVVSELKQRASAADFVDARFHLTGGHALFEEQPDWCAQQVALWWQNQTDHQNY